MNKVALIKSLIADAASIPRERQTFFFKTGPGQYAEHDKFIGVKVPVLRKIAKAFSDLSLDDLENLMLSPFNEERLFALFVLILQYKGANKSNKEQICQFYLKHRQQVNNWNLVDASAHLLLGAHLWDKNRDILLSLAESEILWERRIAMVSTWYFIRKQDLEWTFRLARQLLQDPEDLMHKAVGWMLREAGKQDEGQLRHFLDQHAMLMPRTMLRYAIERLEADRRVFYLAIRRAN